MSATKDLCSCASISHTLCRRSISAALLIERTCGPEEAQFLPMRSDEIPSNAGNRDILTLINVRIVRMG
ncbi:hypothetical protein C8Q80DRAFT_492969 [Daedaleopsis nitida]|nr:hypothetical protein C8Q80DRAFT_492969 [Daedaleopsis nitida]